MTLPLFSSTDFSFSFFLKKIGGKRQLACQRKERGREMEISLSEKTPPPPGDYTFRAVRRRGKRRASISGMFSRPGKKNEERRGSRHRRRTYVLPPPEGPLGGGGGEATTKDDRNTINNRKRESAEDGDSAIYIFP